MVSSGCTGVKEKQLLNPIVYKVKKSKLNGNKILQGTNLIGYETKRQNLGLNLTQHKNYGNLTKDQQKLYIKVSTGKAYVRAITSGITAGTTTGVLSHILIKKLAGSPETKRGATIVAGVLIASIAAQTISNVTSINQASQNNSIAQKQRTLSK